MVYKNKKYAKDTGSGELVSILVIIPLLVLIMAMIIDFSLFFTNRSMLQTIARDGARTVSIFGGKGTTVLATPIELQYGLTNRSICTDNDTAFRTHKTVKNAYRVNFVPIECQMVKSLMDNPGLTNTQITRVFCSPNIVQSVGTEVSCEIKYNYISVAFGSIVGLGGEKTVRGVASGEVQLSVSDYMPRPEPTAPTPTPTEPTPTATPTATSTIPGSGPTIIPGQP